MATIFKFLDRRTAGDVVFDQLYDQIMTLELMPGTKVSEAEIADKMGVSRQPVRSAFSKLANLDLLEIRPQRATVVKQFSSSAIEDARFARAALEIEIARSAALNWEPKWTSAFESSLAAQTAASEDGDVSAFHALDEEYHLLIAQVARRAEAHSLAMRMKAQVDRICVLSMKDGNALKTLTSDHRMIFENLSTQNLTELDAAMRLHLNRISGSLEEVSRKHPEFFTE